MTEREFRIDRTRAAGEFGFLRLEELDVTTPSGTVQRIAVRHPGAVAIVAVHADAVLLIRQYRAAIDAALLEIPAGKLDVAGEPTELTAARELEEEVGYKPGRLVHVSDFFTAPGFSDERMSLFFATELTAVGASPHGPEEEAADVTSVPMADVPALLASGEIEDAKTFIGLQWLLLQDR